MVERLVFSITYIRTPKAIGFSIAKPEEDPLSIETQCLAGNGEAKPAFSGDCEEKGTPQQHAAVLFFFGELSHDSLLISLSGPLAYAINSLKFKLAAATCAEDRGCPKSHNQAL